MYGRSFMGVIRATFLIGPDGRIAKVWPKVKVPGHAEEVLAAAKELSKGLLEAQYKASSTQSFAEN